MLSEEIMRDDIEALREEQDALYENYLEQDCLITNEIEKRVADARKAYPNVETW